MKQRRSVKKRKKYKIRWKVVIPFFVLAALVLYLIGSILGFIFSPDRHQITICDFNKSKTLEVMNNHYEDTLEINDYLFYGEQLSFYTNEYDPEVIDDIIDSTIQFKNLCNGEVREFTIGEMLDQRIDVASLNPGYYEVYQIEEGQQKRLSYHSVMDENSFSTIVRDGKVKTVQLVSDPKVINNRNVELDKNYIFVKVEEAKPNKDEIDVFLDPYGNSTDLKDSVDAGQVYHNVSENKEIYKAAVQLKEELEDAGLRVVISKDSSDEQTTLFGENGRLIKAYNAHAKYYIKLGMNGSPLDYARGTEIVYSMYSSDAMAKVIWQELISNTGLHGSTIHNPNEDLPGLISSLPTEGTDGRMVYDEYLYVREAGGKGTLAGKKDEKAQQNTFAVDHQYGMQAIELDYIYLSNIEDLDYWNEHHEEIVTQTTQALLKAMKIENE